MQRKFFDVFASAIGLVMVVALVVAGSLLMWGYSFANSNVHNQLAAQDITFPTAAEFAHAKPGTEITPQMLPYLLQYAGQPLTTGAQAEAYANHFIAYHLAEMPYNGVYATVSAESRANPTNAKLAAEVNTVFTGTTLRGLLLEAYAFSVIATIAYWAGIAAFVLAGIMLVLVAFGFWHARRTREDEELHVRNDHLVVKSEGQDGNGHVKDVEAVTV
ncbi:MAG: hypothetical protein ACLQU9_08200 [Acidimicrobiales bacterium]|jgi:hypothetical protein